MNTSIDYSRRIAIVRVCSIGIGVLIIILHLILPELLSTFFRFQYPCLEYLYTAIVVMFSRLHDGSQRLDESILHENVIDGIEPASWLE